MLSRRTFNEIKAVLVRQGRSDLARAFAGRYVRANKLMDLDDFTVFKGNIYNVPYPEGMDEARKLAQQLYRFSLELNAAVVRGERPPKVGKILSKIQTMLKKAYQVWGRIDLEDTASDFSPADFQRLLKTIGGLLDKYAEAGDPMSTRPVWQKVLKAFEDFTREWAELFRGYISLDRKMQRDTHKNAWQ